MIDYKLVCNEREALEGNDLQILLTSSLVRYFYLPHDGTYGFKGVSEDLTGDSG